MAKRPGFQYRQPRSKMPKLDITISSSQRNVIAGPSRMQQPEAQIQQDDMWGDDDEEYIMLASQVVEKLDANAEMIISQSMNIRDADLSYGRFQRNVRASTQHQSPILDDFGNDNVEDILANVPDVITNNVVKPTAATTSHRASNQNSQANEIKNSEKTKMEVHQTYLTEKMKTQKKEIENLKETLNKLNEKCQIKEGEASTLRYELELNKKTIEQIRKDKMLEMMHLEKEFSEKISKLEKTIETQRSEIEFKNIEIHHKKSRRSMNETLNNEQDNLSSTELSNMFKLHIADIPFLSTTNVAASNFIKVTSLDTQKGLNDRDSELQNNLHALQSIYNGSNVTGFPQFDEKTKKHITTIVTYLIGVLLNYVRQLEMRPFNKYNPSAEHRVISDSIINTSNLNHQCSALMMPTQPKLTKTPVYEKLIYERQMLAVIALLCSQHSCIANSIMYDQLDIVNISSVEGDMIELEKKNHSFIGCLVHILHFIGYAKTLNSHKGFIESTSILLMALARSYLSDNNDDTILLDAFRAIVFCEPDLASLYHLSEFLETISFKWTNNLCNKICSTENNNVLRFQGYNINRYSLDTCSLQIFCCLLQVAFEPYEDCDSFAEASAHLSLLTQITIRMMIFLRNCIKLRANWLFRKNASSDNPQTPHCYCHIVSCITVLLHFCMKTWNGDHKLIDVSSIEAVFKMGTIFLYDTISKHFEPNVLTLGGFPIKNRLQAIYDWILSYKHLFSFDEFHANAINAVNLRRIIWLNEPQMVISDGPQRADSTKDSSIILSSFQDFHLS